MAKKLKKALISGYIGFGNFGDEAIFSSLVSYLKSQNVEVSALSKSPFETSKEHQIKAYAYKSPFQILKAVFSCDILFSGGGSLLQNNTSNRSLYYYLSIINLAKLFGKKVVIFAQGLEGITGEKQIKFVQNTLKKCDLITVRDEVSKEFLNSLNISSTLLCDPVYGINLPQYKSEGYLGIQLRKSNNMSPKFLENLAEGVIKHFKDKKIKILPFEKSYDEDICNEFLKLLKDKDKEINAKVVYKTSIKDIVEEFSTLEYLISMRFHACILGALYGIKTMPVVYDNKVLNMAKKHNLHYVDCGLEKDITDDFKEIEKEIQITKPLFEWKIFNSIIQ